MTGDRIQLNSLTGLRFFAAIAVVLYHVRLYLPDIGGVLAIFSFGFTGVSFFFILSGFVLTWSHRRAISIKRFYLHRVARIWPLHVVTLVLAMWVPSAGFASITGWPAAPYVLTLTQAWKPASPFLYSFNTVSWSLSCEAFFYLLFPVLFRVVEGRGRSQIVRIFAVVVVASVVAGVFLSFYASPRVADYLLATTPLYRIGEFILGMCLATAMKQGWRPKFCLGHAAALSSLSALGLLAAALIPSGIPGSIPVIVANFVMVPSFLALIAASASLDLHGNSRLLSSTSLVRLGRWSFALYLVHELFFKFISPYMNNLGLGNSLLVAAVLIPVCIALSGALYEIVEKPAEKWLRARGNELLMTRWWD